MRLSYAHLCIKAKDLARTEHFYTKILGLDKVFSFVKEGKTIGFYLRITGTQFIEVFADAKAAPGPSLLAHLCLQTDSIDQAQRELLAHGIHATEKKLGCDGSWQIWFKDPDGLDIELHEYTAASSQVTGKDVIVNW